jgi:hypothetical protein
MQAYQPVTQSAILLAAGGGLRLERVASYVILLYSQGGVIKALS